ncbi:MAG: restriction endonuclease [Methanobrevibacter millerae]|uniref:Restriction endonuclease n=1 Tax=Methanobrevibacter millerae TaxID=230361 RepID=A0A8T3VTD9_9EURY|nr:restriction endonuclease [Methanobrevibacter millerae]
MSNIQKPNTDIADFVGFIQKGGKIKPFVKDIKLITTKVAGLDYIENIDEIFSQIQIEDKLDLFRESDNEYDYRAIIVKYHGEKIGYVPRNENHVLSNLMDGGKLLYGVVVDFGEDEPYKGYKYRFLKFKIFLKEEF